MDCQQVEASSNIIAPPINIHIMVVDDDATSLALVSNLLRTLNYEVALFNDPIRALYTLRAGKQYFHLIMTALYMPKMDGFELTRRVNDEFKLPVIMISNDNRESVMYRAIQEGVVLYLLKPFSPNDLRNIWQFAITTKSRSIANPNLFMEETRGHGVEFRAVEAHSVSSSNEVSRGKKKGSKGKGRNQEKANDTKKKAKVVWTDFLQYRFLQAVHYIGLERAVPKKILEVMNVPGLTRENVASHLQKYRIFLRKVAERCMLTSDKTTEEIIWSKFLSRHASFMLEKIQQKRAFQLSSSQNPNIPPFSSSQSSNPNSRDRRRFTHGQMSFAMNLPPYGLGHTASFANGVGPLPMNQHNHAQAFNFSGAQFQNLALFGDPNYLHSSFSVGVDGEVPGAQKGVSNGYDGSCVGFDAMGVGNFGGYAEYSKATQRDEFGQYGIGVGGNNNYNWGLMCNNGVNFGGDSQITVRHSSQALDNKDGVQEDSGFFASLYPLGSFVDNPTPNQQQGNGGDQSHQLYNIYTEDEESPTDPFSIDDQVLDEFMASLLRNDSSLEG